MTKKRGSRTRKVRGGAWFGMLPDDPCTAVNKLKQKLQEAEAKVPLGTTCPPPQPPKKMTDYFKNPFAKNAVAPEPATSVGGRKKRRGSRRTRKH